MSEQVWQTGRVVWRELLTSDVERAQAFYGGLLGWRFGQMDLPDGTPYTTIEAAGAPIGGIAPMTPGARSPASWSSFVSVPSVDEVLHRARPRGGTVVTGPFDVRATGRVALMADPWGATLGLFHGAASDAAVPDDPPEGTFCWETLVAPDPQAAAEFYTVVIGWTGAPPPADGRKPILLLADHRPIADVQQAAPGRPTAWTPYVRVGALEAVRARAPALGGAVSIPEIRIPEVGRVAVVTDPHGAALALLEPRPDPE